MMSPNSATTLSSSSATTRSTPTSASGSTSATYAVRTRMRMVGLSVRATAAMRRAMPGSSSAMTSIFARSTPASCSVRVLLASPRSTGSPAASASTAPSGLSVVMTKGMCDPASTRTRRRAASP